MIRNETERTLAWTLATEAATRMVPECVRHTLVLPYRRPRTWELSDAQEDRVCAIDVAVTRVIERAVTDACKAIPDFGSVTEDDRFFYLPTGECLDERMLPEIMTPAEVEALIQRAELTVLQLGW